MKNLIQKIMSLVVSVAVCLVVHLLAPKEMFIPVMGLVTSTAMVGLFTNNLLKKMFGDGQNQIVEQPVYTEEELIALHNAQLEASGGEEVAPTTQVETTHSVEPVEPITPEPIRRRVSFSIPDDAPEPKSRDKKRRKKDVLGELRDAFQGDSHGAPTAPEGFDETTVSTTALVTTDQQPPTEPITDEPEPKSVVESVEPVDKPVDKPVEPVVESVEHGETFETQTKHRSRRKR